MSLHHEDVISRSYAVNQIEMAMKEARTDDDRQQLSCFKEFLLALPSQEELEECVCCTECAHLIVTGDNVDCRYGGMCYFLDPDNPAPKYDRCYYTPIE